MRKLMQSFSSIVFDAFIADRLGLSYGQYKAAYGAIEQKAFEERYFYDFRKTARRAGKSDVHSYFETVKFTEQEKSRQECIS